MLLDNLSYNDYHLVLFTFLPPLLQYLSLQNVRVLGSEY